MEPAALTDAYRQAQAVIAARTGGGLTVAWNTLLSPADIDGTFPRYADVARRIIDAARTEAAATAGAYYTLHREALGVDGAFDVLYAADVPAPQALVSLLVTGPVTVKQNLGTGSTLDDAMRAGLRATIGAGYRMAANGGRDTISNTTDRDPRAIGYQRVTDGRPCAFCAMLAGRGPVYKNAATAGDGHRYHDRCGCHPEPVYFHGQPWATGAEEFANVWADSGAKTLRDFRAFYDAKR